MKTKLEKHTVCVICQSVGNTDPRCICCYENRWESIELDFEACECCGNLIDDGNPADTEFNKEQLKDK